MVMKAIRNCGGGGGGNVFDCIVGMYDLQKTIIRKIVNELLITNQTKKRERVVVGECRARPASALRNPTLKARGGELFGRMFFVLPAGSFLLILILTRRRSCPSETP